MFTGIIEDIAIVKTITPQNTNIVFELEAPFVHELKIDQSVAHNGVCLTVTEITDTTYTVVAIDETISKTSLGTWQAGDIINLERCMPATGRFDGHIVQGHVDTTGNCKSIDNKDGSWLIEIEYDNAKHITVEKGSICLNGISLTVVDSQTTKLPYSFSVAIIPYTFEHTNLNSLQVGTKVNLEFDIIGKYLAKLVGR